jgi:hypothetical protein
MDLLPFCSTDPSRPELHNAFTRGDFTYATDGHILVRVPARPGIPDLDPDKPPKFAGLIASLEPRWLDPDAKMAPLPECEIIRRDIKPCKACGGRGRVKTCGRCRGLGTIECGECGHENDCGNCRGNGALRVSDPADANATCDHCGGDGIAGSKPYVIARFAEQDFNASHIDLIRSLPSVVFAFGDGKGPAVFRFDGGAGALMPTYTRDIKAPRQSEAA